MERPKKEDYLTTNQFNYDDLLNRYYEDLNKYIDHLEAQREENGYDEDDLRHVFECFDQGDTFDKQLKEFNEPI